MLRSKEYLLLLAATLAYAAMLIRGMVIFGTDFTAPFSQRTFCTYVSSVSPVLFVLLLALCARQFTASERGAMSIIDAAPMPHSTFRLIRYCAIACAFLIAAVLPFILCFAIYQVVFDYTAIGGLIASGLILLLPPALLVFGTAMLLGSGKPVLVYVLMAAVLVAGVFRIPLPPWMDVTGSSQALPLDPGNRDFSFSFAFLAGRVAFAAAGIACGLLSLMPPHEKHRGSSMKA
jgi:hypothetical protein